MKPRPFPKLDRCFWCGSRRTRRQVADSRNALVLCLSARHCHERRIRKLGRPSEAPSQWGFMFGTSPLQRRAT